MASTGQLQRAQFGRRSERLDHELSAAAEDLLRFAKPRRFATFLVDPPWRFTNKTGKVAPEHKRLARYGTMTLPEIMVLPVEQLAAPTAHLYLWCPNALLPDGIALMKSWGFTYKSNIVRHKLRKDGGSDGRGVGFYFRNVTELVLFDVRGKNARTPVASERRAPERHAPGRSGEPCCPEWKQPTGHQDTTAQQRVSPDRGSCRGSGAK